MTKQEERKNMMERLCDQRYTYQQIGDMFGVSRQRVHQLVTGYKSPGSKIRKEKSTTFISTDWLPPEFFERGKRDKSFSGRDFLAEIVRIRDKKTCQICGRVWKKGERRLDVHHIDEEDENHYTYANYKKFDRMITLCHKCHLNLEHIRNKMSDSRMKKLST